MGEDRGHQSAVEGAQGKCKNNPVFTFLVLLFLFLSL